MSHQRALTIRAPIKPGQTEALKRLLMTMSADSAHNAVIPFATLPGTHFGRLLVIDEGADTPSLLLTLDCDAPLDERLHDLVTIAGEGLDELYRHCEDYPPADDLTAERRLRYLRSKMANVELFYIHAVGRTLQQIRQEADLRQAIEDFLDRSAGDTMGGDATQVRESVRTFVQSESTLAWALTPAAPLERSFRVREALHKFGVPLLLLVIAPMLIPALIVWVIALRIHERTGPAPSVDIDSARLRALSDREDFGVQNEISVLAELKPGWFWPLTATLFYAIADYSARHIFNNGNLSGLTTVHFARLMKLDNSRRMLFTSYYDGSLESYMNDFIDQVAWVLNGVFGNQVGYPRTRWLFFNGATDERGFKAFLRGHQIPTHVWYSAYDHLAAANADNNAQIRAGLHGEMSNAEAEAWLRRL